MSDTILVINAGSSSIKFAVYDAAGELRCTARGALDGIGTAAHLRVDDAQASTLVDRDCPGVATHHDAMQTIRGWLQQHVDPHRLIGVGHRIVHGGARFTAPVRVDAAVLAALAELVPLAPLHQPHNLAAIHAVAALLPGVPQVACFDTAFHATVPDLAQLFALPHELTQGGVRRYGFHGLSYEYITTVLPDVAPQIAAGRVIVAHLGNGASMCALRGGRSVATTMGLTALDGLPMGTRCGAIDPGALLYLLNARGLDAAALERLLYEQSGLLGVSGISSDMRALLASDDRRARLAIDLFVYRIGRELGSLAAALCGVDGIVFTGGIGENAAVIRAGVCAGAVWLGVRLDPGANARGGPCISQAGSVASAWVIRTDENLMIARHTLRCVDARGA